MKFYCMFVLFSLVGCSLYNPDMLNECPQVVSWTVSGPPQCGYTADKLPGDEQCPTLLNWAEDGCASTQERICAMGDHAIQHVDPRNAWASTTIETHDGCVAHFEGPLTVRK